MFPHVVMSNAISCNGSLTGFACDYGIYYPLLLEQEPDLVLVGSQTVAAAHDDIPPEEEYDRRKRVIAPDDRRPWWGVVDSRGILRDVLHFYRRMEYIRDIIVLVAENTPASYIRFLQEREYEYVVAGKDRVDFRAAFSALGGQYGIRRISTDTGGTLNSVLLDAGLVDVISLVVVPVVTPTIGTPFYRSIAGSGTISLMLEKAEPLRDGYVHLLYRVSG
ncbi:MAG: dihydrofolate reductase family protein [Methanomicrobiales archaeon]|nr:dihydrofolate reductase family protein [Methanomicrobiales archaeon]